MTTTSTSESFDYRAPWDGLSKLDSYKKVMVDCKDGSCERPKAKAQCSAPECSREGVFTCSGCKQVGYCGVFHQREHWKTHRKRCGGQR